MGSKIVLNRRKIRRFFSDDNFSYCLHFSKGNNDYTLTWLLLIDRRGGQNENQILISLVPSNSVNNEKLNGYIIIKY